MPIGRSFVERVLLVTVGAAIIGSVPMVLIIMVPVAVMLGLVTLSIIHPRRLVVTIRHCLLILLVLLVLLLLERIETGIVSAHILIQ